jgi:hypothetical protein
MCCFFLTVYGDNQPLDKVSLNISQSHMAHLGLQLQGIVSLETAGLAAPVSLGSSGFYQALTYCLSAPRNQCTPETPGSPVQGLWPLWHLLGAFSAPHPGFLRCPRPHSSLHRLGHLGLARAHPLLHSFTQPWQSKPTKIRASALFSTCRARVSQEVVGDQAGLGTSWAQASLEQAACPFLS